MEFEDDRDLRYYLDEDPVHVGFANSLDEHVESVQALDFVAGVFR
jgi:hypothetical protein